MRFLRLVVPVTLVVLSLSFAPAQAATGDDPGGGGFLSQLISSLTGSANDPTDTGTGDIVNPPETQQVDPPPPTNDVKPPVTLPIEIPSPNLGNIVKPPAADPIVPPEENNNPSPPVTSKPAVEVPKPIEGDPGGPTANNDQYDVEKNSGATTLSVTSNDDGNPVAVQAVTMPAHGQLNQTGMTTFTYTPDSDFVGTDSFTYQAKNLQQATSNSATATINVASPSSSGAPDQSKSIQIPDECQNEPWSTSHDGCCYTSDGEVSSSGDGCYDPCYNDGPTTYSGGNYDECCYASDGEASSSGDGCYDPCYNDGPTTYSGGNYDECCYASDGEASSSGDGCYDPCYNDGPTTRSGGNYDECCYNDGDVDYSGGQHHGCYDPCYDHDGDMSYSGGKHHGCHDYDGCKHHDGDYSEYGDGYSKHHGCKKHHRHKKHHGDDDDDERCHRDDDHDDDHKWKKHHGDHHDGDGDWNGDWNQDGDGGQYGDMSSSHSGDDEWNGDEDWHGDNEWDKWKKDWNHDWDDDDKEHCDKDDHDGGDLPDTGSPVNLPLLALSGLLVVAGLTVLRRTRG